MGNHKSAEFWYHKALEFRTGGRIKGAIKCLDKAINIDPNFIEAIYEKGRLLRLMWGRIWYPLKNKRINRKWGEEVLKCFNKVLEIQPTHRMALILKAAALGEMLGRYEEAIPIYDKLLELQEKHLDTGKDKLFELYQEKRLDPGKKRLFESYQENRLDTGKGDILEQKGMCLLEMKRYKEAIECFDEVLEGPHYNPRIMNLKARALYKSHKYWGAIDWCINAAKEVQESTNKSDWIQKHDKPYVIIEAGLYIGLSLEKYGRREKAIECLTATQEMIRQFREINGQKEFLEEMKMIDAALKRLYR